MEKRNNLSFAKPLLGILFFYILIGINMYLGKGVYSVEFAFIGFILLAIVFYFIKIDSRFLILPAILLLGFIPFMLTVKQNVLAENLAIYVYYFLVVGVVLQVIEMVKNREPKFDFSDIAEYVYGKVRWVSFFVFFGIIALALFGLDYLLKSGNFLLWKISFAYLSVLCLLVFLYSLIDK